MKKRRAKKKSTPKRKKRTKRKVTRKKIISQTTTEVKVERILIENFVSLQKVMLNLSLKLDHLSGKMSNLLEIFELSARALAEKDFNFDTAKKDAENTKKVIDKLDKMFDQNKILAQGLTLMHERIPHQNPGPGTFPIQNQPMETEGYQKSISSYKLETPSEPKEI